jgi:preprotein translocase subunit YajC
MINKYIKDAIKDTDPNLLDLTERLFAEPRIIGVCADVSQGKSNMLYAWIDQLITQYKFNSHNLYTYALPIWCGEQKISSVEELELIQNSVIILDEFFLFLNLDDRKRIKELANMMQRIKHANNVLIMCGLAHNFNKFISSQMEVKVYKQTTIKNLINGSPMKDVVVSYNGNEKGSTILRLSVDKAIIYGLNGEGADIKHYTRVTVPYMKAYDVKMNLPSILGLKKNVQ